MSGEFCDTNVIVYAHDVSAGDKRDQAKRLLGRLWRSGEGVLSVQVLQETYVTLIRGGTKRLMPAEARAVVSQLLTWRVVEPTRHDVVEAIDLSMRWGISFWDAMVLAAAKKAGAAIVWSEELADGQDYEGVAVRNPFR